jgi:hypothetical protein
LYNLFGLREGEWNIAFAPFLPQDLDTINLTITIKGTPVKVEITGKGNGIASINYDGIEILSAVIPENINDLREISFKLGNTTKPYISSANALVYSPVYNEETKTLEFELESFVGHLVECEVISPFKNQKVYINSNEIKTGISEDQKNNLNKLYIKHTGRMSFSHYSITFK